MDMRFVWVAALVMALGALAFAGGGASWWDVDDARMASKIEMKVDKCGMHQEIEYQFPQSLVDKLVPPAVVAAMNAMHGGKTMDGGEKEWVDGQLFWELTAKDAQGLKYEVMFTPDGQVHEQENQIAQTAVPGPVQTSIGNQYGTGTVTSWEVILDAGGAVVEYHVKLVEDAGTPEEKHHKVIVQPNGFISGAYLEVQAELEIPVPVR
jgi:hypothetical protein